MKDSVTAISIVIVEDEQVVREYIKGTLEDLGYLVAASVSTGEEALAILRESAPDVVLMDIQLKGELDGIETAARIASHMDVPLIYLTSYADEATLERAKMTQPSGYIMKPFNAKELRATIEIAVYKHHAEGEAKQQLREELQLSSQRISTLSQKIFGGGMLPSKEPSARPASNMEPIVPAEAPAPEKSYTVKNAAAYLDVSERTIQRMLKEGIFPEPSVTIDLGGNRKLRRWKQSELDAVKPHLRKRGRPKFE